MTNRAFYDATLSDFLQSSSDDIIGKLTIKHTQLLQHEQTGAWEAQIQILQQALSGLTPHDGHLFFEFLIPRMGRRADAVLIYQGIIFVIEFKVGSSSYHSADLRQTVGYALDLKNFHRGSHSLPIVPILLATKANKSSWELTLNKDGVAKPIVDNSQQIAGIIKQCSVKLRANQVDAIEWSNSGYLPTPTIVEAAQALYADHAVEDIARNEADTQNLGVTSDELLKLIHQARINKQKIICFVTGVPGAGKTLVGLNIANTHSNPKDNEYSVFLSGNGPLVSVLQEALAIDKSSRTDMSKAAARRETSQFIQNIHRFRDEALDGSVPPENVAIFDEAQRAWNAEQTSKFMQTKRNQPNFNQSEPEFLIEVMDRHEDWAVIIALIGGGQEINTGEAGLAGWLSALEHGYSHWQVYCSAELLKGEYVSDGLSLENLQNANKLPSLHLATSMRSFRAEKLSSFVHHVIAGECKKASELANAYSADSGHPFRV
ncbi:DNA/RNA helicase domain-containing protein [Photobacterium sp. DNB23_23_1]